MLKAWGAHPSWHADGRGSAHSCEVTLMRSSILRTRLQEVERKLVLTSLTHGLIHADGGWYLFSGNSVMRASQNWTANSKCKRRRKLLIVTISPSPIQRLRQNALILFISAHVWRLARCLQTFSFISAFKQRGRWWSGWWWYRKVCERVCARNLVRMLCVLLSKCITVDQQMVTARGRLLNRAQQLHHYHTHVLYSLSSLVFVLPLILFPLLHFHLLSLTLSLSPLPFSHLSRLVIFVVDLCHLYDFFLLYL